MTRLPPSDEGGAVVAVAGLEGYQNIVHFVSIARVGSVSYLVRLLCKASEKERI